MTLTVKLPDQSMRELNDGATGADLAASIGPRLLEAALAVKVDGKLQDLKRPLSEGATVAIVTSKDADSLEIIRHSTAHLLAQAVQRLFPKAKVGIGPVIEDGFYYDFLVDPFFTPEDLVAIEAEMKKIAQEDIPVTREELSRDGAAERFKGMGEHMKVELVESIPQGETLTGYGQGDFFDLCRGPHVPSTGKLKAFKATRYVSGPAARSYIKLEKFTEMNIELVYHDYSNYPEYKQLFPPFQHNVSILDVLFNCGKDAQYFIWGWRSENKNKLTNND